MRPNSEAALRRQQRYNAIQKFCQDYPHDYAPSYEEIIIHLNQSEIFTAQGLPWTITLLYHELRRNDIKFEDLCNKPTLRGRPSFALNTNKKAEGIQRVKRAITRFLTDWPDRRLPRYTEIALHLNCQFAQVSEDDEPWDADSINAFMETHSLDRRDFVPINAEEVGRVFS